jgi:hypothetical protein
MHPFTSPSPALVEYRQEKHDGQITHLLALLLVLAFLVLILTALIFNS